MEKTMSVSNLTPSMISNLKPPKKVYIKRHKIIKELYVRVIHQGRRHLGLEPRRRDMVNGRLPPITKPSAMPRKLDLDGAR
jgi:hypothetical protein